MMHFTCDQCGKELRADGDARYVVKIEAHAAFNPAELTEADLDVDNMATLSELLQDLEDGETSLPPVNQEFRYDLCPDCHRKFVRDPLGKEQRVRLRFSKN